MIKITSINRKVELDRGGRVSDPTCMALLVAGNDTNINKARFRLSDDEAQRFNDLARDVEKRIGESVVAQEYSPEEALSGPEFAQSIIGAIGGESSAPESKTPSAS